MECVNNITTTTSLVEAMVYVLLDLTQIFGLICFINFCAKGTVVTELVVVSRGQIILTA